MSGLVGNPEDRFSDVAAQMDLWISDWFIIHFANMSMQYTTIFHGCKNGNFQMKNAGLKVAFDEKVGKK